MGGHSMGECHAMSAAKLGTAGRRGAAVAVGVVGLAGAGHAGAGVVVVRILELRKNLSIPRIGPPLKYPPPAPPNG